MCALQYFHAGQRYAGGDRYVSAGGSQHGYAEHEIVSGIVSGKLGDYGILSPFAKEGIAVALGAEYRVETIGNTPDGFSSPAISRRRRRRTRSRARTASTSSLAKCTRR